MSVTCYKLVFTAGLSGLTWTSKQRSLFSFTPWHLCDWQFLPCLYLNPIFVSITGFGNISRKKKTQRWPREGNKTLSVLKEKWKQRWQTLSVSENVSQQLFAASRLRLCYWRPTIPRQFHRPSTFHTLWPTPLPPPCTPPSPSPQSQSKTGLEQQLILQEGLFLKLFAEWADSSGADIPSCQGTASTVRDPPAT